MTESQGRTRRYTRRGVLGASAGLWMAVVGGSAALAGTRHALEADHRGLTRTDSSLDGGVPAGPDPVAGTAARAGTAEDGAEASDIWGVSSSGRGIGVRGNGLAGVRGEGTHTGVAGDGFVGVHGTASIVDDRQNGVGVWAQTEIPGYHALRADGPSAFNGPVKFSGVTTFSRSGVVTVRSGESRVTNTGLELGDATVILATLQSPVAKVHVHAVEVDAAAGSFTIFLTGTPGIDVKIGWLALG
jgi:hypothetical protein